MAAAFSFGFAGDDIDSDEVGEQDSAPKSEPNAMMHTTSLPAKRHSIEELVSSEVIQLQIFLQRIFVVDFAVMMIGNDHIFLQYEADIELLRYHQLPPTTAPNTLSSSQHSLRLSHTIIYTFRS